MDTHGAWGHSRKSPPILNWAGSATMRIQTSITAPLVRLTLLCALLSLTGVSTVWAAPAHPGRAEHQRAQTDPGTGTIRGIVYNDLNLNQVRDTGEPGVASATVELFEDGGTPIASHVTDASGSFEFADVPAGRNYRLKLMNPEGFATTSGDERVVTVLKDTTVEVAFALYQPSAAANTPTGEPGPRETPTLGPTFTPTPTNTPTPTPVPTDTPVPTETPRPTDTVAPTVTTTVTPSLTPSVSPTPSPTGTFFPLTPIATYITTTPGVMVTVTPAATPGRAAGQLPTTGSGTPLLWAVGFGVLMVSAGLARRLFFRSR